MSNVLWSDQTWSNVCLSCVVKFIFYVLVDFYFIYWLIAMSLTQENMTEKKIFNFEDESQGDRLARKSKEAPFFPIAIAGCLAAVGFGVYKYRQRGKMSTSVFLMQLRVGAQGVAVGALTLGLLYTMINEHVLKKKN